MTQITAHVASWKTLRSQKVSSTSFLKVNSPTNPSTHAWFLLISIAQVVARVASSNTLANLGMHSGKDVTVVDGRFGPYIQTLC